MTNFGQNWLKVTIQNRTPEKRPKSPWNWRKIWPSRWKKSCSDRMFNKSVPKKRQKMTQNGPESQKGDDPWKTGCFAYWIWLFFARIDPETNFDQFFFIFLAGILAKVLFWPGFWQRFYFWKIEKFHKYQVLLIFIKYT